MNGFHTLRNHDGHSVQVRVIHSDDRIDIQRQYTNGDIGWIVSFGIDEEGEEVCLYKWPGSMRTYEMCVTRASETSLESMVAPADFADEECPVASLVNVLGATEVIERLANELALTTEDMGNAIDFPQQANHCDHLAGYLRDWLANFPEEN